MEFTQTPLGMEYVLIQQSPTPRFYTYQASIVTEQGIVEAMSVVSIDWIRDYRQAAADKILVEVVLPWGTYVSRVLPFKENLKVTLLRTPVSQNGHPTDDSIIEQTFNAFLESADETEQMGTRPDTTNEQVGDITSIRTITLQLQEEAFSILRTQMVGGVFRETTPMDVLMSLMVRSGRALDLDLTAGVQGYRVVPPDNTAVRRTVMIPHGLPLVALADELQKRQGGIYNTGIGCYYQQGWWWIWPLHNHQRQDEVQETALFVIPPNDRLKGVERTWRMNDKQLVAMITGGVKRIDLSDILQLNEGTGTRFANTDRLIEGFFDYKDNKAVAKRTHNASEYNAIERRSRGMTRVSADMMSSNAFEEASKITQRNGAYLILNWENSDPDKIVPGMQCEVAFTTRTGAEYVPGVVVEVQAYSALAGSGMHQHIHQTITAVTVMVDRHSPIYQRALNGG